MITCVCVRPQLDKVRSAYHKVSRKEQAAREREAHAQGNPDVAIDKQKKIQEERELAQQEAEKVRNIFISCVCASDSKFCQRLKVLCGGSGGSCGIFHSDSEERELHRYTPIQRLCPNVYRSVPAMRKSSRR